MGRLNGEVEWGRIRKIKAFSSITHRLKTKQPLIFYNAYASPLLTYAALVWLRQAVSLTATRELIERIETRALRAILGVPPSTPRASLYAEADIRPIEIEAESQTAKTAIRLQMSNMGVIVQRLTNWISIEYHHGTRGHLPVQRQQSLPQNGQQNHPHSITCELFYAQSHREAKDKWVMATKMERRWHNSQTQKSLTSSQYQTRPPNCAWTGPDKRKSLPQDAAPNTHTQTPKSTSNSTKPMTHTAGDATAAWLQNLRAGVMTWFTQIDCPTRRWHFKWQTNPFPPTQQTILPPNLTVTQRFWSSCNFK